MNAEKKMRELGTELANKNGDDTNGWDSDDFANYLIEAADWREVLRVSWAAGSFAGIQQWRGLYYSFDDSGTYGPYDSFKEARSMLQLDAGNDEIVDRWVSPVYVDDDHD
jgi:hypothetical protein